MRRVGEALRRHRMIEDGDRVLLAISGGKDSSVLAYALSAKKKILPIRFELIACHIVTDLLPRDEREEDKLDAFFSKLGIPLKRYFVPVIARAEAGRGMNCFFCAMQRRKKLLSVAKENGCCKVAYGHHLDDIIETLLMNMFYKAEISSMPARLELDRHDIVMIRPLCATKEKDIAILADRLGLSSGSPPCPYGERGRRARIKKLISELASEDERIRDNLAASLGRVRIGYLQEKQKGEES